MEEEKQGLEQTENGGGVSRRNFLKVGIVGGAVLVVGYGAFRHLGGYAPAPKKFEVLTDKEYDIIQKMGEVFFPAGAGGTPVSGPDSHLADYIDNHLFELRPQHRKLNRALFHVFEHSPIVFLFSFKKFSKLSLEKRQKFLESWAKSSLYLRRQLFTSAKALMGAGYFSDPQVKEHFGYASNCDQ